MLKNFDINILLFIIVKLNYKLWQSYLLRTSRRLLDLITWSTLKLSSRAMLTQPPSNGKKKVIPIETIEQFYYDEGLQYRMIDSSNPFFEGGHYQREWTVDFWEEVERGYLEDFLKDYLIQILK